MPEVTSMSLNKVSDALANGYDRLECPDCGSDHTHASDSECDASCDAASELGETERHCTHCGIVYDWLTCAANSADAAAFFTF